MMDLMKRFVNEEEGQTATEYMLIISVIVGAGDAAADLYVDPYREGGQDGANDARTSRDKGKSGGEGQKR